MRWGHRTWMVALWTLAAGCADPGAGPAGGAEGIAPGAEDPELGKALFEPAAAPDAKEDSLQGRRGPPVTADDSDTAVWEVWNDWEDTDTPDARKAGIAWPADSGLTWDEKYALWIRSMKKIDSTSYFQTYELTTPYGKTLPAPALECAETSIFLRATFASWYHLPFFLEASDRHGNRIYLGHFGFRTADGRYANTPRFAVAYSDYSDRAATWQEEGWPTPRPPAATASTTTATAPPTSPRTRTAAARRAIRSRGRPARGSSPSTSRADAPRRGCSTRATTSSIRRARPAPATSTCCAGG